MKILIFTFSGTGNTYKVADFIANALKSHDCDVIEHKVEDAAKKELPYDFGAATHILIGYPIYAFNAPKMVIDFIKRFPQCTGQKISIFKTAGEPFCLNKCSSNQMKRILTKRGYTFLAERNFLMPYNVMFRYKDELAKQMYLFMQKSVVDYADKIANSEKDMISCGPITSAVSFLLRHIMWGGARFNGRLYTCDMKKCTMCKKCVRECPSQNIRVQEDKICFDGECLMCMRCVQRCPVDAINIGLLRFWAVRGEYDFERLAHDESVRSDFVNPSTRGYFRLFRKYFGVK